MSFSERAHLEIALKIDGSDRNSAGAIYTRYGQPFLSGIAGATSKQLLIRDEDAKSCMANPR